MNVRTAQWIRVDGIEFGGAKLETTTEPGAGCFLSWVDCDGNKIEIFLRGDAKTRKLLKLALHHCRGIESQKEKRR